MKKLALLGLALAWVSAVAFADQEGELAVEVMAKSTYSWDGSPLPAYPEGTPEVTILKIGIPAGAKLAVHKHPIINAGILTQGSLTVVTLEGERLHLKAGDTIVEVVNKWHYGINEGSEPAEIIVFYAGIEGVPLSIKQSD